MMTRNYKPRLFHIDGYWFCHSGSNIGVGVTTEEAYSKWIKASMCPDSRKQYIGEISGIRFFSVE